MYGSHGGRLGLVGGLTLLLAASAPPSQAQDGNMGAFCDLAIEPYVLFQAKWPEQQGAGGFSSIYVSPSEAASGKSLLKQSNTKVSLRGNCPSTVSLPNSVHFGGPAGSGGVDLGTTISGSTLYTRPPDPTSAVAFRLMGTTWNSRSSFHFGWTYVGVLIAAKTQVWTVSGYYTGSVPITVIPQ